MANLVALHVYPIKSARGIDLAEAVVEPWGLAGDRRWMLVDESGRFISQRKEPRLATVTVRQEPDGAIVVRAPSMDELRVEPTAEVRLIPVSVWESELDAALAADDAHTWFGKFLGTDVRLVHLDDPTRRRPDQTYAASADRVSFADGYPLLLTTTGSLEALDALMDEPLPMNRFRPSVVVDEPIAWAEDAWRRVRIGAVTFRVVKPCGRCIVTTTDQRTGERGHEPLRTLARHRRFGKSLVFGQNLVPDLVPGEPSTIRVGDAFEVVERVEGGQ
ncbi:MOSC N-terminal beta barrel domain-containing protein [Streptomyces sp. SID3343]|uniref:MOSC domain-containing protein n=1 Tax=Streptomyces sp. SID3343 TaxID=2690260 RepID=UPI001367AD06|nr:MOSC N-terminal beta barrel domain-containing protein [Streptomyces sp. SID3343]MYW02857.1 MOSC domain-containing protein [Streptomyces sp. SID3343]